MSLSYEEMVRLTETKLEQMGVTKGARRKIVASIQKLQERQCQLKAIDEVREAIHHIWGSSAMTFACNCMVGRYFR